ncbi:hypothetical protein GCM10010971_00640 [Silvimonas amylolytica]|uniref:Uncharacterized protein n=1 Tax=Silvimonas amylolytica TaxID=449663 RepID=A0ABQ2PFG5_9NEIS|nr:hypothetical protein GCM10010971_00640 [Silvimonas amylolytica]
MNEKYNVMASGTIIHKNKTATEGVNSSFASGLPARRAGAGVAEVPAGRASRTC